VIAGTCSAVQNRFMIASPVSLIKGAAPGAAGISTAS
jgi:hypothetical protein